MFNIFINGVSAKTGGGKSILNNYLALLKESNAKEKFYVLTPDKNEYIKYSCHFIEIVDIPKVYRTQAFYPLLNGVFLPRMIKRLKTDYVFNMGDVVIPTTIPQLYLYDWPYAVYPKSVVWKRMDLRSYLIRTIKLYYFKKYIRYATIVAAQSKTMKERLISLYGLKNVEIVPNAVSLDNLRGGDKHDFMLPNDRFKLLYLTHYYPHKNHEVILPLAKKIQNNALPYCIVITIEATQHNRAKRFLDAIYREGLNDTIINVGPVRMTTVPSLYSQCDALFMPTLLESFSGTYVEAMYHRKPILTSNMDFAKDVCGDAAYYFNPLDSELIFEEILHMIKNDELRNRRIEKGERRLKELFSWDQVFARYQELMGIDI